MTKSRQSYKHCRHSNSCHHLKDSVRFSLLAVTCSFLTLAAAASGAAKRSDAAELLDEINLGIKASEQAHELEYKHIGLTLRSAGPGWGQYGRDLRKMTGGSRGVYRIYSHTDAFFKPSPDEPPEGPGPSPNISRIEVVNSL